MNKLIRFIQNYLIIALPFVIACMIWSTVSPEEQFLAEASALTKIVWEVLSINLMCWFAVLVLFLTLSVLAPSIREKTLRRLANLKERDEREQYITGQASRAAYISTLSLTLFFLFFSIFSLKISSLPNEQTSDGHQPTTVNISFHFSLLNRTEIENRNTVATPIAEKVLFDSENWSFSTPAILLILLCWQLLVFNVTARQALRSNIV